MRARCALWAVAAALLAVAPVSSPSPAAAVGATPLPRFTFSAGDGGSILIHGTYPKVPSPCRDPVQPILHARYNGVIEVGKDDQGKLFIIGMLPFEDYLKGIGEVPRVWPMEALKAQVVAARSYALAHIGYPDATGKALGYQLCASDACQVYLGLRIVDGPYGDRWGSAVDQTAGQVLLYKDRPADTVYFSTSNGHTLGNEEVFGSSPLPYLRPVVERDDGGSPVSRWLTTIALSDLTRYLRAAGAWGSGSVTSVSNDSKTVTLRGGGHSRKLPVSTFRNDLNYWAHCLDPNRYPTLNAVNGTGLPQTVPSIWFQSAVHGGAVALAGRGWGHGVGLVQWGAEGKAARGLSYRRILAAYYGGLQPQPYAEPSEIRIGIAVGLQSVTVSGTGPVTVEGANAGPGPWRITGGNTLRISQGPPPPTHISAGTLSGPGRGRFGRKIAVTISLPQLSVVNLVLARNGTDVSMTKPVTLLSGSHRIVARIPRVVSGTYVLQAVVTDGVDIVRTPPHDIRIAGIAPTPSPSPSPKSSPSPPASSGRGALRSSKGSSPGLIAAVALIGVALVGGAAFALWTRLVRARSAGGKHGGGRSGW
jgi:SpoIID/LytB domain protein